MTHPEAAAWLKQVRGRAYRNRREPDGPRGWVAVVLVPGPPGRDGRLVVGIGPSLVRATEAVRRAWDGIWESFGPHH